METEKKAEAAGGPDDTVRHWRGELDRAERAQRDWTRRAAKVVERYRAEKRIDGRRRFNILWANTEILKPVIYSQTPAPDVRRRYLDDDPVGREASLVHSRAARTIVNVPLGGGRFEQYAMDTQTGAWARWTGLDSHVWGVFDENAHFGAAAGAVNRVTGNTDAGAAIAGDVQTAFNAFGRRDLMKRCICLRPVLRGKSEARIGLGALADFRGGGAPSVATGFGPAGAGWENAGTAWEVWDDLVWEGGQESTIAEWRAADGLGYSLGARLTSRTTDDLEWETLTYQLETGRGLI